VLDNYATHKTPKVAAWLKKRPRYHLHFTPTGSSWLNQIERWFAKITEQRIRRGVFRSVDQLIAAIDDYIAAHNKNPKPFVWTANADLILGRVERLCKRTNPSPH
jgi:putative transposase